ERHIMETHSKRRKLEETKEELKKFEDSGESRVVAKQEDAVQLQKGDPETDSKIGLLHMPNEILTKIILNLYFRERNVLGKACKYLYKLENETGGQRYEKVQLMDVKSIPTFLLEIKGCTAVEKSGKIVWIENRKTTSLTLKCGGPKFTEKQRARARNFLINADIEILDTIKVLCKTMQAFLNILATSSYQQLHFSNNPKFTEESARFANTLMNSANFKLKLIKVEWYTRVAGTEKKDLEFFRSFPSANTLSLSWYNYISYDSTTTVRPKPELDSTTLLDIVSRFKHANIFSCFNRITTILWRQVFQMICDSTGERRIRLNSLTDEKKNEFVQLLQADSQLENLGAYVNHVGTESYLRFKHRTSGTVMSSSRTNFAYGTRSITFWKCPDGCDLEKIDLYSLFDCLQGNID
ncbi:hypothetical protein PFISCL1PPCAC_11711, partial [Pristionchus fissidentatus]